MIYLRSVEFRRRVFNSNFFTIVSYVSTLDKLFNFLVFFTVNRLTYLLKRGKIKKTIVICSVFINLRFETVWFLR